ncbi:hypothetical protein ACTXT7_008065 [Hymenolepis weldensis]
MCVGEKPERKLLHFGSKSVERVYSYRYLGSPINTLGDATEAISGSVVNGRRQLMKIGPILPSSVLAVQTKAHLVEIFVSPAIYHRLSTIVLIIMDKNRISALRNTTRRVILGLKSGKILMAEELVKRVPLNYPSAVIQRRRLSKQKHGLTRRLIGSRLREKTDKNRAHAKCWNRQLQTDAKEFFSGDAKGWLANPYSKIPEND